MTRAERLRYLRSAARLSQVELATRAGVDQATISLLEGGQRRGRPETWARLAQALGVPVAAFLAEQGTTEGEDRERR